MLGRIQTPVIESETSSQMPVFRSLLVNQTEKKSACKNMILIWCIAFSDDANVIINPKQVNTTSY